MGIERKMVRAKVTQAEWSPNLGSYVVLLHEVGGDRSFPLFVKEFEAHLINSVHHAVSDIPYGTVYNFYYVLEKLGVRILKVNIVRSVFLDVIGKVFLKERNKTRVYTCSPGGAIELALRCAAPIYVQDRLLVGDSEEIESQLAGEELERLKAELQKAIDFEEYEEAAKLRDKIQHMEKSI
jgi:bifunctional DNase/RNase